MSTLPAVDYLGIVVAMSTLALVLGAMFLGARTVARWARARGRRPRVWVLIAYAAVNVAIGLAQVVVGGGR